ncbi:hypothetical protein Hanom_Chr11g01061401 [Helianthus anomalus]
MGFEPAQVSARDGLPHETGFGSERVQFKSSYGPDFDASRFEANRFDLYRFDACRFNLYHFDASCFDLYRFGACRFNLYRVDPYRQH